LGLCDFVIFRGIMQFYEALIENSETAVSVSELVGVPVQSIDVTRIAASQIGALQNPSKTTYGIGVRPRY